MKFKKFISDNMLKISLVAILLIPLIYSVLFALSAWDPYGRVDRLSVALVNEDVGTKFNDKDINIGNEFVKKLKENKSFNWHFVNRSEAEEGFKKEKYYMVLYLNKDFSTQSASLNKTLNKIQMNYKTNQNRDYVADLITTSGAKTLVTKLNKELSEQYLNVIGDKLEGMKKSLDKAANASSQLLDGSLKISNGLNTLNNGLNKLNDGHHILKDKVSDAKEQYSKLNDGVELFRDKFEELNKGQAKLHNGLSIAKDGTAKLVDNGKAIVNGINKLDDGLKTLNDKLSEAVDQSNKPENEEKLNLLHDSSAKVVDALSKLSDGAVRLNDGIKKMDSKIPDAETLKAKAAEVRSRNIGFTNSEKFGLIGKVHEEERKLGERYDERLGQIAGFKSLEPSLQQEILSAIKSTEVENVDLLMGVAQKEISTKIKEKTADQKEKVLQLIDGLQKIREGLDSGLADGMNKLDAGLKELNTKYPLLNDGVNKMIDTIRGSKDSINKLHDGVSQLKNGSQKLNDGYGKYHEGVNKLDNGISQIMNGENKIIDGSKKLQNGINTINTGSNRFETEFFTKLNGGIDTLKDGSSKLVEGSNKLAGGGQKISDGLNKLSTGLVNGKKELYKSKLNKKAADVLSNPIVLNKETKVSPNYGTAFIAYQLPLGIYLSAIALTLVYPLSLAINKTKKQAIKDKFKVLTAHGIVASVVACLGLQLFLKLQVSNSLMFYSLSILIALAFTYFIAFMTYKFKDIGKYLILIFFIIQLSTAGGTFPIELSNKIYTILNKLIPLTYAMKGITYSLFETTLQSHYFIACVYMLVMSIIFGLLLYSSYNKEKNLAN